MFFSVGLARLVSSTTEVQLVTMMISERLSNTTLTEGTDLFWDQADGRHHRLVVGPEEQQQRDVVEHQVDHLLGVALHRD